MPSIKTAHQICFTSLSTRSETPVREMLKQHDILLSSASEASLWLVVTNTMGDPEIGPINCKARSLGIPLLILRAGRREIEYALYTAESACWACFEKRHRLLDGPATYLYHVMPSPQPVTEPVSRGDDTQVLASRWIVTEIKNFLRMPAQSPLPGSFRCIDLDTMTTSRHSVARIPLCPVCAHSKSPAFPHRPNINTLAPMLS